MAVHGQGSEGVGNAPPALVRHGQQGTRERIGAGAADLPLCILIFHYLVLFSDLSNQANRSEYLMNLNMFSIK